MSSAVNTPNTKNAWVNLREQPSCTKVQNIIKNEKHWFNEPMKIPAYLKTAYDEMTSEANAKLIALGELCIMG